MRGQPIDGAVLLVGCDKTTPSLLMAAASTDLPSIVVTGGPMLNGYFRGERVGSGTHLWKFSEAVKAGEMTQDEFLEAEASMSRSSGHLQHDGDRVHHGVNGRGAGHGAVGQRRDPRGGLPPPRHGAAFGTAHRADGEGRSEAIRHHDANPHSRTRYEPMAPSAARPMR